MSYGNDVRYKANEATKPAAASAMSFRGNFTVTVVTSRGRR